MRFPVTLATQKAFDAVGFGLNAVDHLIVVPEYPAFDTKIRLLEHKQSAGGQTATAMVALQRLGFKTAYAGRFGSDSEGRFGLATLKEDGVDTRFAEMIEGASTQIAFIIIDKRNGERTIVWDRDDRLAYKPEDAPVGFGPLGRVLHLDAHDPPACARVAREAKTSGTIVSADIDNVYEGLPDLLPLIDVLVTSREFPYRLTGIRDERQALMELKGRYGCAVVGMTQGVEGALLFCGGEFVESAAFAAPGGCRDTTGAGDAFHAGLLFGLLSGEDVEMSLHFGHAVAAIKCSELGARSALPSKSQLEQFLLTAL
jgi:sugar/nucleoside kinase (ribokinase family)